MLNLSALLVRIPRHRLVAGALAVVLLVGAAGWMLRPERHTITVLGLGEPVTFTTTERELGAALKSQGLAVTAEDTVEPGVATALGGQKQVQVTVRKAVPVTLVDGDQARQLRSSAQTVWALLQQQQVTLGELDLVSVPLDTALAEGMRIEVTRRVQTLLTAEEELPYETVRREDATLALGTTRVVQEGAPGLKEIRRRVLLANGREVASEIISETVIRPALSQIIAYGTVGVVSRGGQDLRYTRELTMTATGYTAGKESNPDGNGLTYTGIPAVRGIVAVDPRVIPLHTRLYIEGYGPAYAADIGGAIKGNKIDLCFETVAEALQWGIRPVKVYVLSD